MSLMLSLVVGLAAFSVLFVVVIVLAQTRRPRARRSPNDGHDANSAAFLTTHSAGSANSVPTSGAPHRSPHGDGHPAAHDGRVPPDHTSHHHHIGDPPWDGSSAGSSDAGSFDAGGGGGGDGGGGGGGGGD